MGFGPWKGRAATGLEFERGSTFLYRSRYGKLCTYRTLTRDNSVLLQQTFLGNLLPENLLHGLHPLQYTITAYLKYLPAPTTHNSIYQSVKCIDVQVKMTFMTWCTHEAYMFCPIFLSHGVVSTKRMRLFFNWGLTHTRIINTGNYVYILNNLRRFYRFICLINCISFGDIVTVHLNKTVFGSERMQHTPPYPHSPHPSYFTNDT